MGFFSWFRRGSKPSTSNTTRAGYYRGRHYTAYVGEVKALRRRGDDAGAERLLLALVDVVEAESRAKGPKWGVAPWYYEELAKLYRRRKDYAAEVAILERFSQQPNGAGVKGPVLRERLDKARALLAQQSAGRS